MSKSSAVLLLRAWAIRLIRNLPSSTPRRAWRALSCRLAQRDEPHRLGVGKADVFECNPADTPPQPVGRA